MHAQRPTVADDEVQGFAFCVGKTIQNYGTIEYLVNELIAVLTADSLVASHLIKQGISKRIDVLESLVNRRKDDLAKLGFVTGTLFASARSAFQDRNKIAHNPFVIREKNVEGKSKVTAGIHVVRYREAGQKEEWIERARLEELTVASRDIVGQFNVLLGCCKAT
jgi:hypothetical protein